MALDPGTVFMNSMASDQEKFLAAKLLERNFLMLTCVSMCDKIQQPEGAGIVANFVRYNRMDVPLSPLSEGVAPLASALSNSLQQVFLDQWGALVQITDVAIMTTKHPLLATAIELLADNAQRVIDREVQVVWLAGTNVQYFDGSVTSRAAIVAGSFITDTVIGKAITSLFNGGAQKRGGPASGGYLVESADSAWKNKTHGYVAITAENVVQDIQKSSTSLGTWASVAMYNEPTQLYVSEAGMWRGIRWVSTNFIPFFTMFGNTTVVVTSGSAFGTGTPTVTASASGGTLATGTYYFKVVSKTTQRGFAENISIAHTIAVTGATGSVAFAFPATLGLAYDLYFDGTSGGGTGADSTLFLVSANIAPGTTVTVVAPQTTGTNPPQNINPTGTQTVYPIYVHGANSCNLVTFQNLQTFITPDVPTPGANALRQLREVGYKFMQKASIRNPYALLRIEVNSSF